MMEFRKYLPNFYILPFSLDIEFPSHVMLGQSVSMKCTFTKKENQQVKKINLKTSILYAKQHEKRLIYSKRRIFLKP